eukprot:3508308-Prymnesium_polylepis.3
MSTRVCSGLMLRTVVPSAVQKLKALEAQHVNAGPWMGRTLVPSTTAEEFLTCVAPAGIGTPFERKASSIETRDAAGASFSRLMMSGVATMRRMRFCAQLKFTAS